MTILSGIPVLNCHSIESTLSFYQQLLQFVIVKKREINGQLYWVHIMHGETTLMLQAANDENSDLNPVQQSSISLYFFVNNINDLQHLLKAKSNIFSELSVTDYGMQEFTLLDPEGNTLIIGQKS